MIDFQVVGDWLSAISGLNMDVIYNASKTTVNHGDGNQLVPLQMTHISVAVAD